MKCGAQSLLEFYLSVCWVEMKGFLTSITNQSVKYCYIKTNQGLANNNNNIIVSPSLLNNMNDCFLNKRHSFHRLLPCLQSSVCGTRAPALFDSDLFKKKTKKKKHSCVKWLWFLFIGRLQLIRDITCIGTTLERVFKTCTCSR